MIKELIDYLLGLRVDIVRLALSRGDEPLRDDSEETSLEELDFCIEEV